MDPAIRAAGPGPRRGITLRAQQEFLEFAAVSAKMAERVAWRVRL